jgi:UPF0755 protein
MKRLRYAFALIVAAIALVAIAFVYSAFWDRSRPATMVDVVIANGATFNDVLATLRRDGVIAHALPLHVLARIRGDETKVRAGEYRFSPHQSAAQVLHALVTEGAAVARWVTIPEGFTDAQIAERLQAAGVGNARDLARAFASGSIVVGGTRTKSLEGFLFPDTYLMPVGASPAQIEQQMERAFMVALPRDAEQRARAMRLSVPQIVTVASLVEREAKVERDRPLIAGVIYHRLRLGMPLQIDATIEYVLPKHKTELSESDLAIASPYNTYLHVGLPPTPIANPGGASLEAAFHPAATKALYYVYCGGGRHVFADTLAEHRANIARCLR